MSLLKFALLTKKLVVMQIPEHALNKYRAVFDNTPLFEQINGADIRNLAGFHPLALPLAMGGSPRGSSGVGIMIM